MVPPIFDAVEFNSAKQLQDSLDPFTVEFMLTFRRICGTVRMQSRNFELLLCILSMLFESELLLTIPLRSLSTQVSLYNGVSYYLTLSQPEY